MRRRKTTISIAALTALTLITGCSSNLVEDTNGNVLTMTIGDKTVSIKADDLLDDYLQSQTGLKSYYDAVYEVVVRELFEQSDQTANRNEAYDKAEVEVKSTTEKARANASGGGSYDKELDALLQAEGVETLDEYREKKAYEFMKTELKDQYFDGTSTWATGSWDDLVEDYLNERLPYHVRHILIKVGAGSNTIYNATITKDDARNLGSAVRSLATRAQNETFGTLAKSISQDEGSAKENGDLKIMDIKTGFVNEFKLGVHAYEGIYSNNAALPGDAADKLGIPAEHQTFLENLGLAEVPYEAALDLVNVADIEKDENGEEVNDGEAKYFPRNVLFNKYFNRHNVAIITPTDADVNGENGALNPTYQALSGFEMVAELGKEALVDEKGNVILMVRAGSNGGYEGVHFISIERSALVDDVNGVSLEDYYTIKLPKDEGYPTVGDQPADTFVNYFEANDSTYRGRVDYIKEQIKGFDPRVDDRIFSLLFDHLDVELANSELEGKIFEYIAAQEASSVFNDQFQLEQSWNTYTEYLTQQEFLRANRLVPETCVVDFETADKSGTAYDGGVCYYAK